MIYKGEERNVVLLPGDCMETLKTLPDCSVQCVVTSPPYYGLRDYGTAKWSGGDEKCKHNPQKPDGGDRSDRTLPLGRGGIYKNMCKCGAVRIDNQIGLEQSPEEYISKLVAVFREVRRVLKPDGTFWLNLGDSFAGSGCGTNDYRTEKSRSINKSDKMFSKHPPQQKKLDGLKPKDLMMIPARVALALQADGWWLRSEIIWHKPNPMPESVTDRPTKSHEMIYLLAKSQHYFYDAEAIREPYQQSSLDRCKYPVAKHAIDEGGGSFGKGIRGDPDRGMIVEPNSGGRNKRDVWTVSTKPYKEAHFATFPPDLIEPCILAGSRIGDTVLDPFNGSGTTGAVSIKHGRDYIGCELNPEYIELTMQRLAQVQPVMGGLL